MAEADDVAGRIVGDEEQLGPQGPGEITDDEHPIEKSGYLSGAFQRRI